MFRGHHRKVRLLFGLSDLVLTALAFELAYRIRMAFNTHSTLFERNFFLTTPVYVLLLGWSMAVWVGLGVWSKTYDRIDAARARVILRDAFRQCLAGAASIILLEFALRVDLSRPFLAMFTALLWALLCLFRLNAGRLLGMVRREFGAPSYVMVVGIGEAALRIGRQIEDAAAYGIRLSGFLAEARPEEQGGGAPEEIELAAKYPVRPLAELPDLLRGHVIDEVIFAVDSRRLAELEEMFLLCEEEGVRTRVAVDFFPHINSQVYLDRLGTSPLLTFSATPSDEIRLLVKRATDIVLGGLALAAASPVMLLVALLIRLTSPGPIIFRQTRCGLNGRRFTFYKFRSMCEDAEAMRAALEHRNEKSTVFKIHDDPRLTGVGRWLRKFSIDEWPQLWNVLKGDMSLVGPRPLQVRDYELFETFCQDWQRRRFSVRPGITCLWQIKGRSSTTFEKWMELDLQYIRNWSLWLDLEILAKTVPAVLKGSGAA